MGDAKILEGCVDSVLSAVAATAGGANRLELCSNLIIGGTSPSPAMFRETRKRCRNRIHILIRPRYGDFCYGREELDVMLDEVMEFRELGADGIVIGNLNPDGSLNEKQMERLIKAAGDMSVTLNRAFDVCSDPSETLERAVELGIDSILTSGQKDNCILGKECIRQLVKQSAGRIEILVGSGVNAGVIHEIRRDTGAGAFHMSGKKLISSRMEYRKTDVHMGLPSFDEYGIWTADENGFREAAEELGL